MTKEQYVKKFHKQLSRGLTLMKHSTRLDNDGDPLHLVTRKPDLVARYGGWVKVSAELEKPKAVKTVEEVKEEKKDPPSPPESLESAETAEEAKPKRAKKQT